MISIHRIRQEPSHLRSEKGAALDLARGRLALMGGFFVLAYSLLALRAMDLSVIQAKMFEAQDTPQIQAVADAQTRRADLLDRHGEILATALESQSLFADTRYIADKPRAAQALSAIFPDLSYRAALEKMQSGKSFVWVRRNMTPDEQMRVLEIGEPGLVFERGMRRFYPQGAGAVHVAGYTNIDNQGLAGVERGLDDVLQGDEAVSLTIDIRLQHALRREIAAAMEEFRAIGGAGVIMDVRNGEVLAAVSLPDFDPHHPAAAGDDAKFNRLTLGAYELGSVFKIFSTAAFFESRDLPMNTTFDAREPLKIGKHTINDFHAQNRIMSVPEVFMHSSNIGTAMMAQAVGGDALRDFYTDLGLLDPLDFEIREVAKPMVPQPWREINTLTASYGHGLTTTPVQVTAAVASIVNGGILVRPHLVKRDAGDAMPGFRVVSEKTAHRMRQLLRLTVSEGTGSKADVKGYIALTHGRIRHYLVAAAHPKSPPWMQSHGRQRAQPPTPPVA